MCDGCAAVGEVRGKRRGAAVVWRVRMLGRGEAGAEGCSARACANRGDERLDEVLEPHALGREDDVCRGWVDGRALL